MSTTIKIPECMNPFVVVVNNQKYSYPAGTTQEVPDEVAVVIENHSSHEQNKYECNVYNQSMNIQPDLSVENEKDQRYVRGVIRRESLPEALRFGETTTRTAIFSDVTIEAANTNQQVTLETPVYMGDKLGVIFNGVDYGVVNVHYYESTYAGNIFDFAVGDRYFMEYPFYIRNEYPGIMEDGVTPVRVQTQTAGDVVSLYKVETEIVPIPEAYIPETIARVEDVTTMTGELDVLKYSAQDLTEEQKAQARENIGAVKSWNDLTDKPFYEETVWIPVCENYAVESTSITIDVSGLDISIVGIPTKLVYNAVEYEFSDITAGVGDVNLVEYPFYVSYHPRGTLYVTVTNVGDVLSLYYSVEAVTPMEEKYLPESISRTPDWNQTSRKANNRIDNKPFGEVEEYVLLDEVITTAADTMEYTGMSVSYPSSPLKIVTSDGTEYEFNNYIMGDETLEEYPFYITISSTSGTLPAIMNYKSKNANEKLMVYHTKIITKQMDETYIPSTIARSASSHGLTVPDAAGETVTAEEFNALLTALRNAGYLAT